MIPGCFRFIPDPAKIGRPYASTGHDHDPRSCLLDQRPQLRQTFCRRWLPCRGKNGAEAAGDNILEGTRPVRHLVERTVKSTGKRSGQPYELRIFGKTHISILTKNPKNKSRNTKSFRSNQVVFHLQELACGINKTSAARTDH